jgi:hypothetical protein
MKKYIFFLLVFLLLGCELIVDIKVPFDKQQLVVNSFFTPDSVWSASVSLNQSILDSAALQHVSDALVVIYQNGLPIDTLIHTADGEYKSDAGKPNINTAYEIKVSAPGHEPVHGVAEIIPPPIQITGVDISESISLQGHAVSIVTVKFKDDAAATNFYQILVEKEYDYYDYATKTIVTKHRQIELKSNDNSYVDIVKSYEREMLRKDVLFNGKDVKLSFKADYLGGKNIFVTLRTLTEDYYNYKATSQLQFDTDGDPLAQPVNVFNNINNGFGIFAGYSQSIFVQSKPVPEITSITPMTGKAGDHFIITGKNFSSLSVSIITEDSHYQYCRIVSATETKIEAVVPAKAVSGKVLVETNGYVLLSDDEFVVE